MKGTIGSVPRLLKGALRSSSQVRSSQLRSTIPLTQVY